MGAAASGARRGLGETGKPAWSSPCFPGLATLVGVGGGRRGPSARCARGLLCPWGAQWPLGGIFHSARACAVGPGFQGPGLSGLHLLPLGSIRHPCSPPVWAALHLRARRRGPVSSWRSQPGGVGWGEAAPDAAVPTAGAAGADSQRTPESLPVGVPGRPCAGAQGSLLLAQVPAGGDCACRPSGACRASCPEGPGGNERRGLH